ncbi:MAG: hypothetical protein GVY13_06640 [Alphaproteobacteria bacterium]|jgi:uncharacterized membrane protein YccC|nr:hypothetical protein [Alphaproteobacteria bacterium]
MLSVRTKEAIKTALAMVIAFGIAMALGWEEPVWAGVAVAVVSLATIGQSLNKAAMRMLGTLVAAVVALALLSLFPQDRWGFLAAIALYFGICTYLAGGSRHQYFWQVCGFVCLIVAFAAIPQPEEAFSIAVLRAQETGLGILVYSLVSVLLWPVSSRSDFHEAACSLMASQHGLYRACRASIDGGAGGSADGDAGPLCADVLQQQARFGQLLAAAETDSHDVYQLRRHWRHHQALSAALTETMERWRAAHPDLMALDMRRLLPGLDAFCRDLDTRFDGMERMLAGEPPREMPEILDLTPSEADVDSLPHFHRAALMVARNRLQDIERLTRRQFETLRAIQAGGRPPEAPRPVGEAIARLVPDTDRLVDALRVTAVLLLACLGWIYVDGLPGGAGFVVFAGALAMIKAAMPQIPVQAMFVPAIVGGAFSLFLYIGVMPHLSSFTGLAIMLFAATFAIYYWFYKPSQALGRLFGVLMFLTLTDIASPQSYDFTQMSEMAVMFPLIFALLAGMAFFPHSPRPEKVMLRQLGRFFRSSEYLMSTMRPGPVSPADRWRRAFHRHEIETLPGKMRAWGPHLETRLLPGTAPEQVEQLVTSLQTLSFRIQELLEARRQPLVEDLVRELLVDVREWRLKGQAAFRRLSAHPAAADEEAFRQSLEATLETLEARMRAVVDRTAREKAAMAEQGTETFYRLLGAYRALSEAMVDYAGRAAAIDWAPWREARF